MADASGVFATLPLKKPPLAITSESVSMLPVTWPVAVISTSPVATRWPSYRPMITACTVRTSACTTPFCPMTSLPPTVISPPISHSIWIESEMSNVPSSFALGPSTLRSCVTGVVLVVVVVVVGFVPS